ncbi:MAG: hypothetical protein AB7S38_21900 [Vulcanimicrobiota bacterium]
MALRMKNLLKRKMSRLQDSLRDDLERLVAEGKMAEAVKKAGREALLDPASAAEFVMSLQSEMGRDQVAAGAVGLLKEDLKSLLAEGETREAVDWCCHETGLDPKQAALVIEHLKDESPASVRDKTVKTVDELGQQLRSDVDQLLIEGKTMDALRKLRQEKGLGLAVASAVLQRLRQQDVPDARQTLLEQKLEQLKDAVRADVVSLLENGQSVQALHKLRDASGLDLPCSHQLLEKLKSEEGIDDLEKAAEAKLGHLEDKVKSEIEEFLDQGDRLHAVKLCQQKTGLALGVAAAVVDAVARHQGVELTAPAAEPMTGPQAEQVNPPEPEESLVEVDWELAKAPEQEEIPVFDEGPLTQPLQGPPPRPLGTRTTPRVLENAFELPDYFKDAFGPPRENEHISSSSEASEPLAPEQTG